MPVYDRFGAFPVAVVVHIIGAAVFALVGIFLFLPGIRRRHRASHRRAGRLVAAAGLAVAGSALWLTLFYEPQLGTGDLLYVLRLLFVSAMTPCLVLGFTAIRRRDIASHRAWMIRAYALGLGADTQPYTEAFGGAIFGDGVVAGDLARGAAWFINLAVAEWVIRRHTRRRKRPYELRVAGHLDDHWSAMLGDLALARGDSGTTTLTGPLVDQAQLHVSWLRCATSESPCCRCARSTPPPQQQAPSLPRCPASAHTRRGLRAAHASPRRRPRCGPDVEVPMTRVRRWMADPDPR